MGRSAAKVMSISTSQTSITAAKWTKQSCYSRQFVYSDLLYKCHRPRKATAPNLQPITFICRPTTPSKALKQITLIGVDEVVAKHAVVEKAVGKTNKNKILQKNNVYGKCEYLSLVCTYRVYATN